MSETSKREGVAPVPLTARETLLWYSAVPSNVFVTVEEAHPSIARITLQIVNDTDDPIPCSAIFVTVPIGTDSGSLAASPSMRMTSLQPATWARTPLRDGEWVLEPIPPVAGLDARQSISFEISNILVNKIVGAAPIGIRETTDRDRETSVIVNKERSELEIKSFFAAPPQIEPGGRSLLSWETRGAVSCTLVDGRTGGLLAKQLLGGSTPVDPNGDLHVTPAVATSYTLIAHGDGPDTSRNLVVTVRTPTVISFTASASETDPGKPVTLSWKTEDAEGCRLEPDGRHLEKSGTVDVKPDRSTTYEIFPIRGDFTGPSAKVPITVRPVIIDSFHEEVLPGAPGRGFRLTWSVRRSIDCTIDQGIGTVKPQGWRDLPSPGTTTPYRLLAIGGGSNDARTIAVKPRGWYDSGLSRAVSAFTAIASDNAVIRVGGTLPFAGGVNKSTDIYAEGSGWTTKPNDLKPRWDAFGAYFNETFWLFGGTEENGRRNAAPAMSSPDGLTWKPVSTAPPWGEQAGACTVFDHALWTITLAGVYRSNNGTDWQPVSQVEPIATRSALRMAMITDAGIVAADFSNAFQSKDGATWTRLPLLGYMSLFGAAHGFLWSSGQIGLGTQFVSLRDAAGESYNSSNPPGHYDISDFQTTVAFGNEMFAFSLNAAWSLVV